jgi:CheY-like chemotaxis protein
MYQVLPPVARDLAIELESILGTGGARTRLKVGAALAAAAVLRDTELWRSILADATEMGEADVARLALDAAMRYAYAGDTSPADATTRILRLALIGSLRSEEQAGDDPLVAECSQVIDIVHAMAIARGVELGSEEGERAAMARPAKRPDSNRSAASPGRIQDGDFGPSPDGRGVGGLREGGITPPRTNSAPPPQSDKRDSPPVSQRAEPQHARVHSSMPPNEGRKEKSGGPRVLLVDDDDSYSKLLQRMLSPLDVVCASNGIAALEHLASDGDFEIVLSKVELPDELSSAQMYDTIKRKWPHLAGRVIFVSSHGSAPEGQPLLRKPINRDSLLRTIGRLSKRIAEVHQK